MSKWQTSQALPSATSPDSSIEPHADQTAVYDRKFEAYEALLTALDGGWAALRDMQNSLER